jgi:dTDP-4-dehydrorhamnose 3,5-epimerase
MKVRSTPLAGLLIIEPTVFHDQRGFFYESFNARRFAALTGVDAVFVQDNHSRSAKGVLRGLHYQIQQAQGKLVRASVGSIYDVVLDMRKSSPTFGHWQGLDLSAENKLALWVPPGFAHGFYVTSDVAEVQYQATDYWAPGFERAVLWNDPALGIAWPLDGPPLLSAKDQAAAPLAAAECYP